MFRTFIKVRHTTQDETSPLLQFPIAVLTGMFQTTLTDVVIDPLGSSAYGIAMFHGHSPIGLPVKCVWQSGHQMLHLSFLRDNLALPICSDSALWQMGIAIDCMVDENITYRHGDVEIIPTASYYDSTTILWSHCRRIGNLVHEPDRGQHHHNAKHGEGQTAYHTLHIMRDVIDHLLIHLSEMLIELLAVFLRDDNTVTTTTEE